MLYILEIQRQRIFKTWQPIKFYIRLDSFVSPRIPETKINISQVFHRLKQLLSSNCGASFYTVLK